jgi:hypothetical protein
VFLEGLDDDAVPVFESGAESHASRVASEQESIADADLAAVEEAVEGALIFAPDATVEESEPTFATEAVSIETGSGPDGPLEFEPIAESAAPSGLEFAPEENDLSDDSEKLAREWILEQMPTFLYLDEYPEIEGSLNIGDYVRCRNEDRLEPRHHYFEKLLIAAGLQPSDIDSLLTSDAATRRRIVSHAGLTITRLEEHRVTP